MRQYSSGGYRGFDRWVDEYDRLVKDADGHLLEAERSLYEGDMVRVLAGPYRGLTGMITLAVYRPDGNDTIYVQLNHPTVQMRGPIPFPPDALERKPSIDATYYVDSVSPTELPFLAEARPQTPVFVKHCVRAVAQKHGGDTSRAFAICVAQMQKAGLLYPGTIEMTGKGKKAARRHSAEPEREMKLKDYEAILKKARKTSKEAREEPFIDPSDFTISASAEPVGGPLAEQVLYYAGMLDADYGTCYGDLPDARVTGLDVEDFELAADIDIEDVIFENVRDLQEWEVWMYEEEPEDLEELRGLIRRSVRKLRRTVGKKVRRAGAVAKGAARSVRQSRRENRAIKKWSRRAIKHARRGNMQKAQAYAAGVKAIRAKKSGRAATKKRARMARRANVASIKKQLGR